MKSHFSVLIAFVLISSPMAAQVVHVVDTLGNGAFLNIQSAIDAAATGDHVLVKTGTYPGFTIDGKGLVVSAEQGASVTISGSILVTNIASGDELVLQGFDSRPTAAPILGGVIGVTFSSGHVLLQDLVIEFSPGSIALFGPVFIDESSAFTMLDSRVDGTNSPIGLVNGAISSDNSNIYLHNVEAVGSRGADGTVQTFIGAPGGSALQVRGGSALVVGGNFRGGRGGDGNTFLNPGNGGPGGSAIQLVATAESQPSLVHYDSLIAGGLGGVGLSPAVDGLDGVPMEIVAGTVDNPAAFERRLRADGVVRDGISTSLNFSGQPFDFLWQLIAIDTNLVTVYAPEILGAIHPGGSPFFFRFRGTLNVNGEKVLNFTLNPTGLDYVPLYEQALMYNVTEGFVISNPRFIAFLDSAIP